MRREASGGPGEKHLGGGQVQRPWGGSVARVRVVTAGTPGSHRGFGGLRGTWVAQEPLGGGEARVARMRVGFRQPSG